MAKTEIAKTNRGFDITDFKDRDGNDCSLQKSSLAMEDCIWLGLNKPTITEFVPKKGFFPMTKERMDSLKLSADSEIYQFSRMQLTQQNVRDLLPYLQNFAETGDLTR